MRASLSERIALAAAAVVLVLSSVFLAVGGPTRSGDNEAIATTSPTPEATSGPATATPAPTVVHTSAPVGAHRTPAPTVRSSGGPVRPGPAKPPTAGKYEYTETASNGTRTSTLEIADKGSGKQTENVDSGDTIDEVLWTSSQKLDQATTFSFPQGSIRCDWNPDFADYKFPLSAGRSWTVNSACHPNATTSFTVSGTAHVSGPERTSVGGTHVDVWIVTTDATVTFSGGGSSVTEKIHDEDHFSPDHGITVRDVQTSTGTGPSGQQSNDKTSRDLKNLEPGTQA